MNTNKLKVISLTVFFVLFQVLSCIQAQTTKMGKDIITLVNDARRDPGNFLKKHRDKIQKLEPKFINILENARPIKQAAWDTALEDMCRDMIVRGELDPKYKGNKKTCGNTTGKSMGSISSDPLNYVCGFYTNVMDEDLIYLGVYYQKDGYAFNWSRTCQKNKIKYTFNETIDSSKVNFALINTAKKEKYMSNEEQRMIMEINFVRAYPQVYVQIIKKYLADESASVHGLSKATYDAGIELIEELSKQKPLRILKTKQCLYDAAVKHGEDCKKRGFLDHKGSDGSMPWERITESCTSFSRGNENLAYNADMRNAVISLLLDDGISSRGHRYNLLDPAWKYVACFVYEGEKNQWFTMKNYIQNFAY